MPIQIEQLRQEIRAENRRFILQIIAAGAALIGVGIIIGRFWLFHAS